MPKSKVPPPPDLKYRRVEVSGLRKGRRGKHHELVQGILRELDTLSAGSAMEIPLSDVGGIGLVSRPGDFVNTDSLPRISVSPTERPSRFGISANVVA